MGKNEQVGNVTEAVDYNQKVVDSHIDMNPPQIVEPLTGSSVLVEPKVESKVPNNGFPIGYGPNANMKKIEKPKRPKMSERIKHVRKKMTKKQKIRLLIILSSIAVVVGGFFAYAAITGLFKIDYSETYKKAKELRAEMQKVRSDASCSKVVEDVNNQYTTKEGYLENVEECRQVSEGVRDSVVNAVGDTDGVRHDEDIRKRYNTFKNALAAAKEGNHDVDRLLRVYTIWHSFILAEASGNSAHNDWDWTEADLKNATDILIESGFKEFEKYGEDWLKYKSEAATATNLYFHHALDPSTDLKAIYDDMVTKQNAFNEWKKENQLKITEVYPLELVDTAKLYAKFEEFYDYVREIYQKNYNFKAGGCKELVNSIVCD